MTSSPILALEDALRPGRLWSLWDMMNFSFWSVNHLLEELTVLIAVSTKNMKFAEANGGYKSPIVLRDPKREKAVKQSVESITYVADGIEKTLASLQCSHIDDAVARLRQWPKESLGHWAELNTRARRLRDTLKLELKEYMFFQYSKPKGQKFQTWKTDWQPQITAFPNIEFDVWSATDCYALQHNTASVFHSMRVAEYGLRALAMERRIKLARNKPLEWGTWQDIIKALDKEIVAMGNKKAGPARDAALEFYSGARADLNGFKDEYRNLVMHVRASYDEFQALRALTNVHAFMERLAAKMNHTNQRIKWGRF